MLPESMAPPLENLDEFRAFMAERGIKVMRDYVSEWEDPETGEFYKAHWTVVIHKDQLLPDGRVYVQHIDCGEKHVLTAWKEAWALEADLLEMALRHGVEDHLK